MSKTNIAKNTTYYTIALTAQKILAFIYFWYISSNLIPGQLGQYVFALSFATLFSIFIDLGLSPILTREAAKNQKEANTFLQNVIGIKIPLAVITFIAAWIIINLTNKPTEVVYLVYLASAIMVLDSFSLSFWVTFRARQILSYESISVVLVQLIIFSLGILALKTTGSVIFLIGALLAASIFNLIFSALLLKIKLKYSLRPKLDKKTVFYFLKIMPAFALAGIFVRIYNTSDSVILSFLAGDSAVGFFAVPAKVVFALQQIIPAAFAAVIYPIFSNHYIKSKQLLSKSFTKSFIYLSIISLPITGGLLIVAPEVVKVLWPTYIDVIPTFAVMSLAIPFIFLAFPTGYLLNATDHQKNNTINRGIITFLAITLNISLIPSLGYFGAGLTFLITNFTLLILDLYWSRKIINLESWVIAKAILKSLLATIIMMLTILSLKNTNPLIVTIPFGAIIYFTLMFALKGINLKEIKQTFKPQTQ